MCMEKLVMYRQLLEVKQTKSVKRLEAQWETELLEALRGRIDQLLAYGAALGYEVLAEELQRLQELAAVEARW